MYPLNLTFAPIAAVNCSSRQTGILPGFDEISVRLTGEVVNILQKEVLFNTGVDYKHVYPDERK